MACRRMAALLTTVVLLSAAAGCVRGRRDLLARTAERPEPPAPGPPITFPVVPEVAPVTIEEITVRERIVLHDVLFGLDKAELRPQGKAEVEKAAAYLKEHTADRIIVEGHACELGTEQYNLVLGMRRADAVRGYLERLGVARERVSTVSYGESQPVADNSTEAGRRLNRRVVMEIVARQ